MAPNSTGMKVKSDQILGKRLYRLENNFFNKLESVLAEAVGNEQGHTWLRPFYKDDAGNEVGVLDAVGKWRLDFTQTRAAVFGYDLREKTSRQIQKSNLTGVADKELSKRIEQFMSLCDIIKGYLGNEKMLTPAIQAKLDTIASEYLNGIERIHQEVQQPVPKASHRKGERQPLLSQQHNVVYQQHSTCDDILDCMGCFCSPSGNYGGDPFFYSFGQSDGWADGWAWSGGNRHMNMFNYMFSSGYRNGYADGEMQGMMAHALWDAGKFTANVAYKIQKAEFRLVYHAGQFITREALDTMRSTQFNEAGRALTSVARKVGGDIAHTSVQLAHDIGAVGKECCHVTSQCCTESSKVADAVGKGVVNSAETVGHVVTDVAKGVGNVAGVVGKGALEVAKGVGNVAGVVGKGALEVVKGVGNVAGAVASGLGSAAGDIGKCCGDLVEPCAKGCGGLVAVGGSGAAVAAGGGGTKPVTALATSTAGINLSTNSGANWGWHLNTGSHNPLFNGMGGAVFQTVIGGVYIFALAPQTIQNNMQLLREINMGGFQAHRAEKACCYEITAGLAAGTFGICVPFGGPVTAGAFCVGAIYAVSEVLKRSHRKDDFKHFGDANYRKHQLTAAQLEKLYANNPVASEKTIGETLELLRSIMFIEAETVAHKSFGSRFLHGCFWGCNDLKNNPTIKACEAIIKKLQSGETLVDTGLKVKAGEIEFALQADGSLQVEGLPPSYEDALLLPPQTQANPDPSAPPAPEGMLQ